MATEVDIPLTEGQKASADDRPDATRTSINWMLDNNETSRPRPAIVNTDLDPGVYNRTTGTNTGIIGAYVWRSVYDQREYVVYVRRDRAIYAKDLITNITTALSDGTTPTLLDGSSTQVVFAEDSQRLVMAGGGQLQVWTGTGLTSRIAATTLGVNQPPLSATHCVSLANYLVANQAALPGTNNQIFWSNLGDSNHVTWNPLNFNTADADPDPIVALAVNRREIFAFGTKTIQTFGIGSDPTLPFSSSASIVLGCGAAYSVVLIDSGSVAMLDSKRRFVTTDARSTEWISADIDKLIRELPTVSDCFGFRLQIAFWDLLVWVFPTSQKTFAYDMAKKVWFIWNGWNGVDDFAGLRLSCYTPWTTGNMHIVGDPNYENLWTLNSTVTSDTGPGLPIVNDLVTRRLDQGSAGRKRCERVRFFVRRGEGTTTPGYLDVSKRDDDGPWSARQLIDLGIAGDYRSYVDWFPGGIYRRRQYRIRYSSGVTTSLNRAVEFVEQYGG